MHVEKGIKLFEMNAGSNNDDPALSSLTHYPVVCRCSIHCSTFKRDTAYH